MKKYIRKIAAFAIFLSLFSIVSSVPVKAEEAIEVEARSALLMEASTGKIIYENLDLPTSSNKFILLFF